MKLIYLANARIPTEKAHGLQILQMCQSFALNNEVELWLPFRFNRLKSEISDYYGIQPKFKIRRLPCLDFLALGLGKFGFLAMTFSFLISARICLFFRKFDFLYTREPLVGFFFKNHCLELHYLPMRVRRFDQKLWIRAKKIIVLTKHLKDSLEKAGVSAQKIHVAADGVDLKKFDIGISKEEARKKLSLPSDKKVIVYTGSFFLFNWKGIDVLLEAAKAFGEECFFALIGGERSEIEKISKEAGSNVKLIERQPHGLMPFYLKAADALILPNKKGDQTSEMHTSPLKLFEYMASGRPIVASGLPSLKEILNETNSVLVDPSDSVKLAEGIRLVLDRPDFAQKIAKQALADVQNFSWEKRAEKILIFLNL